MKTIAVPIEFIQRIDSLLVNLQNEGRDFAKLRSQTLSYLKPKKYAIKPGGDVCRNEVLKVIHKMGYSAKHTGNGGDFISRIGFNTIYFEGNLWTNWTDERAKENGFENIISGNEFLNTPELYLSQAPVILTTPIKD